MSYPEFPELRGKAALVTGASRGMGAAIACELSRHGVSVVLAARSGDDIAAQAESIRADGGAVEFAICDVSVYGDVAAAVEQCRRAFGSVDILVNNAGVIEPIARLAESDPARWGSAIDINLKGVYHGLRAAIPAMLDDGGGAPGGVVVNISSGAASSALEGWSHYCSSKAAVLSLTRCADREYRERGVRVVGLSPGTVATDMQVAIKASGINPVSRLDPSAHIPPDWPARAVAWLCSDAAADIGGEDFVLKDEGNRRRVGVTD